MRFVNVWLGLREEAQDAIIERLDFDPELEYTGPVTDREARLFQYMSDRANVQRLFKTTRIGGRPWTLWSLSFTENLAQVQTELELLVENRPNHVTIAGAWFWDGRQVGTQFVHDEEGLVTGVSGTPTYPLPVNALLQFMPDLRDSEGVVTGPAVDLTDVNLLLGQSPRRFLP